MEGTLTSRSDTYIGHYDSGLYHSLCSSVLKDIVLDNGIEWGNRIDSAGFERIIVDLKQVDPHKVTGLNEQESEVLGSLITSLCVEIEAVLYKLSDEVKNEDLRRYLDIDWS